MKIFKKIVIATLLITIIGVTLSFSAGAQEDLLGYYDNGQLLGVSSAFSVFLEKDFAANGSDCEGRIAVGGGANLGTMGGYSTGTKNNTGADVIIGNGPLTNFTTGDRIFVVENEDAEISIIGDIRYKNLINFEKEFNSLRKTSLELAKNETGVYSYDNNWNAQINFIGTEEDYNYFTLPAAEITTCEHHFNFDVPADSYVVINILEEEVDLYTQLYDCQISGEGITSNTDKKNCRIIYNLPNAKIVTLNGIGRFHGSILAPNADVSGPDTDGAHLSGQLIAKSYKGAMEFGSLTFSGKKIDNSTPIEAVTTSTTEITDVSSVTTRPTPIATTTTTTTVITTTEPIITKGTSLNTTNITDTTEAITTISSETTTTSTIGLITVIRTSSTTILHVNDEIKTTTTETAITTIQTNDISNVTIQNSPETGDDIYMVFFICFVAVFIAYFCFTSKKIN